SPPASAAAPARYSAQGTVDRVDADSMTLTHGPIAALKWPAMTMPFDKPSPTAFADVKVGDAVHFEFIQKGADYELVSVHRIGGAQ
ncbi:MAG TPA: copper-binding protein, partial [Roseateles sp.]|nr:copper-binding protein [Roseateles sp.]